MLKKGKKHELTRRQRKHAYLFQSLNLIGYGSQVSSFALIGTTAETLFAIVAFVAIVEVASNVPVTQQLCADYQGMTYHNYILWIKHDARGKNIQARKVKHAHGKYQGSGQ